MKVIGTVNSRPFLGCYSVEFYSENEEQLASLLLDSSQRDLDEYTLSYTNSTKEITFYLEGILSKKFNIWTSASMPNWTYKRKKLIDFIFNRKTLFTHNSNYQVYESAEKLEVYEQDRKIGIAKKVYSNIRDIGEYYISFADSKYLEIFLTLGAILILQTEVVAQREDNFYNSTS